ncbi:hypothetical protein IW261DRAFT_1498396 [Armillaria novae-zelandiae]|uniref:Uncharacterized protein n=1 Tax=Armillaria novae-zelandiae TaxID=153914 RepID=A0AA39U5B0_9AGAR|nr:hypothetical protein IW261DRAFT_1498396 [Armillaria novae-zelandiae]
MAKTVLIVPTYLVGLSPAPIFRSTHHDGGRFLRGVGVGGRNDFSAFSSNSYYIVDHCHDLRYYNLPSPPLLPSTLRY